MISQIDQVLWVDLQSLPPVCFCERCGVECYHPSRLCTECEDRP